MHHHDPRQRSPWASHTSFSRRHSQRAGFPAPLRVVFILGLLLLPFSLAFASALDRIVEPPPAGVLLGQSPTSRLFGQSTAEPTLVIYKRSEIAAETPNRFEVEVLRLALEKTIEYGPYQLQPLPVMNRARAMAALSQNVYPNLVLVLSYEDSLAKQESLTYIPIPIERGVMSYRICFMRDELKPIISRVKSLEQLKPYSFGSGIGWADGKILRHNGLKVIEGDSIISLLRMTKAGRVDLFCRGINEYSIEYLRQQNTIGLCADDHIALYYTLPKFIFANSASRPLLERLQVGLKRAFDDGTYIKLWQRFHDVSVIRSRLKQRQLIFLNNPLIDELPKDYQTYLMNPLED